MPPLGWRKPPGSTAYARRTTSTKTGPTPRARQRSAGVHMLAAGFDAAEHRHGSLTVDSEAGAEPGSEPDENEEEDDEEDNDNSEGPPSKRLRLRKGCPPMAEDGENISADEDLQDLPGLVDPDSSDDEDDGNQCRANTAAARARRAAAARAIDDDDPLEDVRPQATSRAPQQTHVPQVNDALPLLELSVTLSKHKGHVNPAWMTLVHDWMKLRCKAGAVAAERGGKAQHLHLQIILRMHIAEMDIDALKTELKTLVGWQRGDGSGTYCQAKQFGVGQARGR